MDEILEEKEERRELKSFLVSVAYLEIRTVPLHLPLYHQNREGLEGANVDRDVKSNGRYAWNKMNGWKGAH